MLAGNHSKGVGLSLTIELSQLLANPSKRPNFQVERIKSSLSLDQTKSDADEVDEGFVDGSELLGLADDTDAEPLNTGRASNLFQSAADLLKDWSKKIGRNDWSSISKSDVDAILDQLKSFDVNNVVPQDAADQFSSLTKLVAVKAAFTV